VRPVEGLISTVTQIKNEIFCGIVRFLWGPLLPYLGSEPRERQSRRSSEFVCLFEESPKSDVSVQNEL
jgi:hypothetical protein